MISGLQEHIMPEIPFGSDRIELMLWTNCEIEQKMCEYCNIFQNSYNRYHINLTHFYYPKFPEVNEKSKSRQT